MLFFPLEPVISEFRIASSLFVLGLIHYFIGLKTDKYNQAEFIATESRIQPTDFNLANTV